VSQTVDFVSAENKFFTGKAVVVDMTPDSSGDPFFDEVMFLSGFEGADTSTTIVDESGVGRAMTAVGNSQIDTGQFAFGDSSLRVDGSGDEVTALDATDLEIGSQHFTLEARVRFNTESFGGHTLIAKYLSAGDQRGISFLFEGTGNALDCWISSDGVGATKVVSGAWTPALDTWYAIALDFDGTTYRVYVDGVLKGSGTTVVSVYNNTALLSLGLTFDGWMDETRITIGTARYAGAYTIATEAFPRS